MSVFALECVGFCVGALCWCFVLVFCVGSWVCFCVACFGLLVCLDCFYFVVFVAFAWALAPDDGGDAGSDIVFDFWSDVAFGVVLDFVFHGVLELD